MKIIACNAVNFLSFEKIAYQFDDKCVLIQGENLTEADQESNGTGKTAFQSIIEFCLYGNTSQKIRDKDLIRFGQKEAIVSIKIQCPYRKEILHIRREIKKQGSGKLMLSINDQSCSYATIPDGNNLIVAWLGISKEDLQNYYIINRERYTSFFNASNTDKLNIISRFSKANLIDNIDKLVQNDVDDLKHQKIDLDHQKAKKEGIIEGLSLQLKSSKPETFERLKKEKIDEYEQKINDVEEEQKNINFKNDQINNEIISEQNKIKKVNSHIVLTQTELQKVDTEDIWEQIKSVQKIINKRKDVLDQTIKQKRTKEKQITEVEIIINDLDKKLSDVISCPNCNHEFNLKDPSIDLEALKEKRDQALSLLNKFKKNLIEIDQYERDVEKDLDVFYSKERSLMTKQDRIQTRLKELKNRLLDYEHELNKIHNVIKNLRLKSDSNIELYNDLAKKIDFYSKEIYNLQKMQFDVDRQKNAEGEIEENRKIISLINEEISKLEVQIYMKAEWVGNFKKFKGYLANKFLKVIENQCNQVLKAINSDIQIIWEGYKVLSSGSLSDKITAYIVRNGIERNYASFSGGEKAKMNFAVIMTIRELINQAHPYKGLDFLFTDEIFEGLDGLGLSQLMKSINVYKYPILITTHVTDTNIYGNILKIVKKNGISTIHAT